MNTFVMSLQEVEEALNTPVKNICGKIYRIYYV